jgi:L-lactate dehydrogenase complex protein LldG
MSAARDEVLRRIRSVERPRPEPAPRSYRRAGVLQAEERLMLFCERVADYRAAVRRIAPADVAAEAGAAFATYGANRVAVPAGLRTDWRPAGLDLVEDDDLSSRALDRLDGVLTGCTLGIAETGTIVLSAGPEEGRRALTLVPDLHVCVLRAADVVEVVPEAIAALDALAVVDRRPLTFISGPSATSDIELSRVEGVHGPRTLVVLVVNEESP